MKNGLYTIMFGAKDSVLTRKNLHNWAPLMKGNVECVYYWGIRDLKHNETLNAHLYASIKV